MSRRIALSLFFDESVALLQLIAGATMAHDETKRPEPYWWPDAITEEELRAFAPAKLELVNGFLLGSAEDDKARLDLLALLLRNCGLEAAAMMSSKDDWREAGERVFPDLYE